MSDTVLDSRLFWPKIECNGVTTALSSDTTPARQLPLQTVARVRELNDCKM